MLYDLKIKLSRYLNLWALLSGVAVSFLKSMKLVLVKIEHVVDAVVAVAVVAVSEVVPTDIVLVYGYDCRHHPKGLNLQQVKVLL
ncbi:unnamed protein product [[Candida] boidinii]|nr:unnamed protein product [[Candida] boidinii]